MELPCEEARKSRFGSLQAVWPLTYFGDEVVLFPATVSLPQINCLFSWITMTPMLMVDVDFTRLSSSISSPEMESGCKF
jgi:hypothetical protein